MNPAKFIRWCEEQGHWIYDNLEWIIPLGAILLVVLWLWFNFVGGKYIYDLTH